MHLLSIENAIAHIEHSSKRRKNSICEKKLEQKLHSVENEIKFIAKIVITSVARIEDEISLIENKKKTLKCKSSCFYINKKIFDEEKQTIIIIIRFKTIYALVKSGVFSSHGLISEIWSLVILVVVFSL